MLYLNNHNSSGETDVSKLAYFISSFSPPSVFTSLPFFFLSSFSFLCSFLPFMMTQKGKSPEILEGFFFGHKYWTPS